MGGRPKKKALISHQPPRRPPGLILSAGFSQAAQIRFAAESYVSPREDIFCGVEEELEVPAPGMGSWGGQVERSEEGGGRVVLLHKQPLGRSSRLVSTCSDFKTTVVLFCRWMFVSCLVVRHGVRSVVLGGKTKEPIINQALLMCHSHSESSKLPTVFTEPR